MRGRTYFEIAGCFIREIERTLPLKKPKKRKSSGGIPFGIG
jgi:hypothetical protein